MMARFESVMWWSQVVTGGLVSVGCGGMILGLAKIFGEIVLTR